MAMGQPITNPVQERVLDYLLVVDALVSWVIMLHAPYDSPGWPLSGLEAKPSPPGSFFFGDRMYYITLVTRDIPGIENLNKPKFSRQKVDVIPERGHEYQYVNEDGNPAYGVVLGIRHVEVVTNDKEHHIHTNIEVHLGTKLF